MVETDKADQTNFDSVTVANKETWQTEHSSVKRVINAGADSLEALRVDLKEQLTEQIKKD